MLQVLGEECGEGVEVLGGRARLAGLVQERLEGWQSLLL